MQNVIVRHGLLAGAILLVLGFGQWLVFGTSLSYRAAEVIGYTSILVALSVVYFAVRAVRDRKMNGCISFGKAFKIGILTTLFPTLFMFLQTVVFFSFWGDRFQAWTEQEMRQLSAADYAAYQQQMADYGDLMMSPWIQGLIMAVTVLIIGLLISLVSALLLKRAPRPVEA